MIGRQLRVLLICAQLIAIFCDTGWLALFIAFITCSTRVAGTLLFWLRKEFGLADDPEVPLVGIVSRLVDQKGFDLIAAIADELRNLPLQLVVLGTGHPHYEELFLELATNTANVRERIGFDVALSHRI